MPLVGRDGHASIQEEPHVPRIFAYALCLVRRHVEASQGNTSLELRPLGVVQDHLGASTKARIQRKDHRTPGQRETCSGCGGGCCVWWRGVGGRNWVERLENVNEFKLWIRTIRNACPTKRNSVHNLQHNTHVDSLLKTASIPYVLSPRGEWLRAGRKVSTLGQLRVQSVSLLTCGLKHGISPLRLQTNVDQTNRRFSPWQH